MSLSKFSSPVIHSCVEERLASSAIQDVFILMVYACSTGLGSSRRCRSGVELSFEPLATFFK